MELACPICNKVSSVTLHCQLTTQPEIFKLHCFDCNQLVYKCELCYKFQRSTLNNDSLIRNNGKKFRRASCYSIIFQNELKKRNNFPNQHLKTDYHRAVYNHVLSRNSCLLQSTNNNVTSSTSINNQHTTDHVDDDNVITCGLADNQSTMSDSSNNNHRSIEPNTFTIKESTQFNSMIDFETEVQRIPQPKVDQIQKCFPKDCEFYEATRKNAAGQYIMNCALSNNNSGSYVRGSEREALFHVLLTILLKKLNKSDQQVLCSLLHYLKQNRTSLRVPSNLADARKYYIEGSNSLHKQLPQPSISNVGNGYCILKFEEIIRHAFCSKTPPLPFISLSDSIHSTTPRGSELLSAATNVKVKNCSFPDYPIKLLLWSDAFKPLQFNENSIHCMLATWKKHTSYVDWSIEKFFSICSYQNST